ncbi:MAG TPA: hypothetical protein PKO27_15070 [Deltaproteobacteria bacterium]|jgi:hypothetical protein|nr:hypothetical protein [Deltaproteobacteria bacterium]HOE73740.1 hypothetical protein [Deltaproteobacteria bacterium]HPX51290.1 hypothetical protein [Deltaproteobacteria bacterium]HQA72498.1 hypothetical protein [Deltaproteobacteria bacterium]
MKSNVVNHPSIERWSSKRKAELVLEIIKGLKDDRRRCPRA